MKNLDILLLEARDAYNQGDYTKVIVALSTYSVRRQDGEKPPWNGDEMHKSLVDRIIGIISMNTSP